MRRSIAPVAFAGLALVPTLIFVSCQGTFDAPNLNNPRDPANEMLPPTPVINVTALPCLPMSQPRIRVDWTIQDTPELTGFQIYRAATAAEDPGLLVASVAASARTFDDGGSPGVPGLSERTTYWYRVRALGTQGIPGLRSASASTTTSDCL
jgi:hypothetical protein